MEDILSNLTGWLDKLSGSTVGLTAVILLIIGYIIRFLPFADNKMIPAVCVCLGAPIYLVLSEPTNNTLPLHTWILRTLGIGLVVGWLTWLGHDKVISKIEDKLGIAKSEPPPDPPKPL